MTRVLLADDDQFLTNISSRAFERAGYEVFTANDGHEAINQLVNQSPDLVLLDLDLPGIDGIGVLRFIRSKPDLATIPVVIVSNSSAFSGEVQTAWKDGATTFIKKGGFSPHSLVEEISRTVPIPAPSENLPAGKAASGKTPVDRKKILVADDDKVIQGVITYFLGQNNFHAESAFNGLQALEMAKLDPPDLLILDVMMPLLDGFATLDLWLTDPKLADIPVIILTASHAEEVRVTANRRGITSYLTKPFSPESLIEGVNALIVR